MSEMSDHMIEAFKEFAKNVTVPIIEAVNGTIDQVATGTFFTIDDRYFLITAKHIFDDSDPANFAVPSNPIRDPDPSTLGNICLTKADHDFVDLAAIELLELSTIKKVRAGWNILTLEDVSVASQDGAFALCGYPSSAGIRPAQHLIGSTLLAFHTFRVPTPSGAALPVHEDLDLFFQYGKQAESGGAVIATPHLKGTSGCSIWEQREPAPGSIWLPKKAFKIVGVQSAMRSDYSYFRAKSWLYVLQLLYQIDSGLAATIGAFRASVLAKKST